MVIAVLPPNNVSKLDLPVEVRTRVDPIIISVVLAGATPPTTAATRPVPNKPNVPKDNPATPTFRAIRKTTEEEGRRP